MSAALLFEMKPLTVVERHCLVAAGELRRGPLAPLFARLDIVILDLMGLNGYQCAHFVGQDVQGMLEPIAGGCWRPELGDLKGRYYSACFNVRRESVRLVPPDVEGHGDWNRWRRLEYDDCRHRRDVAHYQCRNRRLRTMCSLDCSVVCLSRPWRPSV